MHNTNFKHFLDEDGNIPTDMPKEARELANFIALLIDDASTGDYDAEPVIRCIKMGYDGLIVPTRVGENNEIYWVCIKCKEKGIITNWHNTKWDDR